MLYFSTSWSYEAPCFPRSSGPQTSHPQSFQLPFGQLSRHLWLTSHLSLCPAVSISTCFWKPTLRALSGRHLDSLRKKQGLPHGPSEQASPLSSSNKGKNSKLSIVSSVSVFTLPISQEKMQSSILQEDLSWEPLEISPLVINHQNAYEISICEVQNGITFQQPRSLLLM